MKLFSLVILLFMFHISYSQNMPLTLKVIDSDSSSSISSAVVYIDELNFDHTETDQNGIAYFSSVPIGKVVVNIRKVGYDYFREGFNITSNLKDNNYLVKLKKTRKSFEEIQLPNLAKVEFNEKSINTGNFVGTNYGTVNSGDVYLDSRPKLNQIEKDSFKILLNKYLLRNFNNTRYCVEVEPADRNPDSEYLKNEVEKYLKEQKYNVVNMTGMFMGVTFGNDGIIPQKEKFVFQHSEGDCVIILVAAQNE